MHKHNLPHRGTYRVSGLEVTTPFYLIVTATGTGGNQPTIQHERTVTVNRVAILSFVALPTSIDQGRASTLSWRMINATSAAIDKGVGNALVPSGHTTVKPTQTTTYTLTARGPGGKVQLNQQVTVHLPRPEITSFTAEPSVVKTTDFPVAVTLAWEVEHCLQVSFNVEGVGFFPCSHSKTVTLSKGQVVTLTATGPGGTATQSHLVLEVGTATMITKHINFPVALARKGDYVLVANSLGSSVAIIDASNSDPTQPSRLSASAR